MRPRRSRDMQEVKISRGDSDAASNIECDIFTGLLFSFSADEIRHFALDETSWPAGHESPTFLCHAGRPSACAARAYRHAEDMGSFDELQPTPARRMGRAHARRFVRSPLISRRTPSSQGDMPPRGRLMNSV